MDVDSFFELLSKCQSKRMDDQRCTLTVDPNKENMEPSSAIAPGPVPIEEAARPPSPPPAPTVTANGGVVNSDTATGKIIRFIRKLQYENIVSYNIAASSGQNKEELMELIAGMQSRRMDEQRATLPQLPGLTNQRVLKNFPKPADDPSLPDDNFFDMLMRCQVKERLIPYLWTCCYCFFNF